MNLKIIGCFISLTLVWLAGPLKGASEPGQSAPVLAPTSETQSEISSNGTPVSADTGSSATGSVVKTASQLKKYDLEELLSIEVTSVSRSPMALADAPSALQVITNDEIRRSGASSIPEALRLANNLEVAQKNAHDWGISARGFNTDLANKLLVMIDGRTVYTPLFSGVRWDVQDYLLEDIDRIEVVSGPGGSVWGANAVNGVINVVSKSAKDTQGFYGEIGGGDQLREFSSLRYGGTLASNVYFRVYAKYTNRGDEVLASGADVNDATSMTQGGFRLDAETATQGKVTLQGDYYHGAEGMPGTGDSNISGGNILGRWSQLLSNGSDVRLQLYFDRTYLRQPFADGALAPAGYFAEDLRTYDADFQQNFKYGHSQSLVWGLGYRFTYDKTSDAPTLGFSPPYLDQVLLSAFFQDQIAFGPNTSLTFGTKVEHNDYTGFEWEPSIRLQHDLAENKLIWGAISRAVRTPSRIDRDILEPSHGLTILGGGADFESETVVAYEAGYRAEIGPRLIGSVSVFYNDYNDIRSLRPTAGTFFPLVFANDLEGETHGLEFSCNSDFLKWWRFNGGYTLLKSHLHVRSGGIDLNNALNETSDPQNQFALGSSMDLPHGIEFDANLRWVDTLYNNNNGRVGTVPSYTELNLRLGFHFSEHLEFSLVGQNLLNDQHPEFGTPGVARVQIHRGVFAKLAFRY